MSFTEEFPQPPYVTRLDTSVPCQATVYSRYSIRKAGSPDPEVRRAHAARIACKLLARWHHVGIPLDERDDWSMASGTGDYCWSHLIHDAMGGMEDVARYEKWLESR